MWGVEASANRGQLHLQVKEKAATVSLDSSAVGRCARDKCELEKTHAWVVEMHLRLPEETKENIQAQQYGRPRPHPPSLSRLRGVHGTVMKDASAVSAQLVFCRPPFHPWPSGKLDRSQVKLSVKADQPCDAGAPGSSYVPNHYSQCWQVTENPTVEEAEVEHREFSSDPHES